MSIGQRIKKLREESGKLQKEVAADLGITTSALGLYEIDYRKVPPELLVKIANYFNTTTDYILGNSDTIKEEKYQVAFHGGLEGLDEEDIKEVIDFINYIKSKKNN